MKKCLYRIVAHNDIRESYYLWEKRPSNNGRTQKTIAYTKRQARRALRRSLKKMDFDS